MKVNGNRHFSYSQTRRHQDRATGYGIRNGRQRHSNRRVEVVIIEPVPPLPVQDNRPSILKAIREVFRPCSS